MSHIADSVDNLPDTRFLWHGTSARRLALIGCVLLVTLFYSVGYWNSPERPDSSGQHPSIGWKGWWDQGNYYRSVAALQQDNLAPAEHLYPIGYPLIGIAFARLLPDQPFFFPDLFCYIAIAVVFVLVCQQFFSAGESLALCFFAVIWPSTIMTNMIRPWTNTPVGAALSVLALLSLTGRKDRFAATLSGVCASLIVTIRPGDVVYSWPLIAALWLGCRDWLEAWRRARWFLTGALPFTAICTFLSFAIHGALVSGAYSRAAANVGFSLAPLGLKLYTFLIDGYLLFGESRTLVTVFPLLLLVVPGIVLFVKHFRWRAAPVLAAQAGATVYFLAFNDFWISNIFRNGAIRYWLWMVPFWTLYAYLTVRLAWRKLSWLPMSALLVVPVLLWIVPQMSVRFVPCQPVVRPGAAGWSCEPSSNLACSLSISLAKPAEFDVLKVRGVPAIQLIYVTAWIDGRRSPDFQDHYISDGPDGQTYLIFYSPQHGKSIRLDVPTVFGGQQQFKISGFQLGLRHSGLSLRNPYYRFHPELRD